ncbi:MAG: phage major capsid protein [Rhodoferax sp.]|uniref:phage major capsid protein n=1 Tax=Rhodoferax sp. TaxID=50421 RepID=UPI0017DCDCDC|nr:phage major capsid protein [Rhodoferax sp.]NMM15372.1 phage major capsid protein [Rhodoferax sp.]
MSKAQYIGTEENARNAWTTLCAKNGMPEAVNIGTNASSLSEAELHAMRKTARRALNAISDQLKPNDYNDATTDALVFAGNAIAAVNEAFERMQDAEKFFGKSKSNGATKAMRNSADFAKHYETGHSQDAGEYDIADYLRGIANLRTTPSVKNALSVGTDAAGGFAVPGVLMPSILSAMVPVSALLTAGAGIIPLEQGAKTFTSAAINAIPTAAWRAEGGTLATSDPTFRAVVATPRSLSFMFKVSRELLADAVGLTSALNQAIAQAFAKELDRAGLRGSGTAPEPRGLLNTVGIQGVTNGAAGTPLASYANLFSAYGAILQADGPAPTAAIMSPRSLIKLGGLVSTTGEPLDVPTMLQPLKLIATSQIPNTLTVGASADCSEIYVGDFSQLYFAMRESVSIQLLQEAYASTGEIGFACHVRADVVVNYPAAFAVVTGVRA